MTGKHYDLALDIVCFEWAQIIAFDSEAKPCIDVSQLGGMNPAELKLGLQPYLTLLSLRYPVDNFVLAVKRHDALRGEASNAIETAPKGAKLKKVTVPKISKVFVAVHRHNNRLYYKRLESREFALLSGLRKGLTVEEACQRALRGAARSTNWSIKLQKWFESASALGWFC